LLTGQRAAAYQWHIKVIGSNGAGTVASFHPSAHDGPSIIIAWCHEKLCDAPVIAPGEQRQHSPAGVSQGFLDIFAVFYTNFGGDISLQAYNNPV
jgi:hypothetical protein